MHPVGTGLVLAVAPALGTGDEVRSTTSMIFFGVGTTSMTLSSPPSSPLSSAAELDGAFSEAPAIIISRRNGPSSKLSGREWAILP